MTKAKTQDKPQDQTPKQQLLEQLRGSESIVVATSMHPSLDEVAAAKALVLILSKLDKKVAAVVGADLPRGAELLKPKNVFSDSLDGVRDFVIELNVSKTKADKFRYDLESDKLKIFITPFNGTYTQEDLSTSQGDFNVDTVMVLGLNNKTDLSEVAAGHDELLANSKIVSLNAGTNSGSYGDIKWYEPDASSISEMLVSTAEALGAGLDKDTAETLLTGIISATEKFTNTRTTPKVMTMSAQLMAAGADQHELIAMYDKELNAPIEKPEPKVEETITEPEEVVEPAENDSHVVEAGTDIKLEDVTVDENKTIDEIERLVDDSQPETDQVTPDVQSSIDQQQAVDAAYSAEAPAEVTLDEIEVKDEVPAFENQVFDIAQADQQASPTFELPDVSTAPPENFDSGAVEPQPQPAPALEQVAQPLSYYDSAVTVSETPARELPEQNAPAQPEIQQSPLVTPIHSGIDETTSTQELYREHVPEIELTADNASNGEFELNAQPPAPRSIQDITSENDFLAHANQAVDAQIQPSYSPGSQSIADQSQTQAEASTFDQNGTSL